jgi:hypothetical protein
MCKCEERGICATYQFVFHMHSCLVFTKVVLVNKFIHLFMYFSTKGGLVVEVKVGYFLVFFCGEG